jgi:hypothetical protein
MAQIWQRVTGDQNVQYIIKKTGTAIVIGELLALDNDSYDLFAAATDKLVYGIALDAAASSSTAQLRVDRIDQNDVVRAKVATGTAAASEIGAFVDIGSSTTGITLTESNNDAVVVGFPKTGYLDICFGANAAYPTPTTTVSD